MLYKAIELNRIYRNQKYIPLPIGTTGEDGSGQGEALFVCAPSYEETLKILATPEFRVKEAKYKRFYTDLKFYEKIGTKRVAENKTNDWKPNFEKTPAGDRFNLLSSEAQLTKAIYMKQNLIVDVSHWCELYFIYQKPLNVYNICNNFVDLMVSKINRPMFDDYHKTLCVPVNLWAKMAKDGFGITKEYLTNPVSILFASMYRFPDIVEKLKGIDIYFVDFESNEFMKLDQSFMDKKHFSRVKQAFMKFKVSKFSAKEEENAEKDGTLSEVKIQEIEGAHENKPVAKVAKAAVVKAAIKKSAKKAEPVKLTAPDVDPKFIDTNDAIDMMMDLMQQKTPDASKTTQPIINPNMPADEPDDYIVDREIDSEIEKEVDDIDEDELEEKVPEIEANVKKKVLITKFKPDISEEDQKRISDLLGIQNTLLDQSIDEMKTKLIPPADFSEFIDSKNEALKHPKARNFVKAYNDQKLEDDIDKAILALNKCDYPLFLVKKEVEDTSDSLNLKKTYTYTMSDSKGAKHIIKFDFPILIDDRYIYLGGNKKVIQNQMLLMPVLKSGPNEVQVVSFYNKIFIYRKGAKTDLKTERLKKFMMTDESVLKFKIKIGNATLKNMAAKTPLDYDTLGKNMVECTVAGKRFIFDVQKCREVVNQYRVANQEPPLESINTSQGLIIGVDVKSRQPIYIVEKNGDSITDMIMDAMPPESKEKLARTMVSDKGLTYAVSKMNTREIPLVFFMCWCVGLLEVFKRAKTNFDIVEPGANYDMLNRSAIRLKDKWILWDRYPFHNSLIFNGLQKLPLENYTLEEIADKRTYQDMLSLYWKDTAKANVVLDQFKDFMIDPVTAEILSDMNLPTNIVDIFAVAAVMLNGRDHESVTNMKNIRIRSTEILAQFVYKNVADAYLQYRKSIFSSKPMKISVPRNLIAKSIYGSVKEKIPAAGMIEDASVLNPILELEKNNAVSFKGPSGINLAKAFNLPKRSFDPTMTGVVGISTSPDANVGVQRELTLDPPIISTRGYLDVVETSDDLEDKTGVNLFTASELLSPPGVMHDDGQRTSMAYKQSKYMVLVENASPVLIGNKVEAAVPYYLSREFVVTAKMDGKVVDIKNDMVIIQYEDGTYDSFSLEARQQKNSAGGFYIETKFATDLEVGSSVTKGEVVAYNPKAFTKNKNDRSASMNIGVLTKLAIVPNFDEYEDSAPITKKLANDLATEIVMEETVVINMDAYVKNIVQVGDKVEVGDSLIEYDNAIQDPTLANMWKGLSETFGEELLSQAISKKASDYTGEIVDIRFYSTVDGEDLSETLKPLVEGYWNKLKKKQNMLKKYANKNDPEFYKCGQLITEVAGKTEAKFGKILGYQVDNGVLIRFFIKHKDIVKKGDKVTRSSNAVRSWPPCKTKLLELLG